MLNDKYGRVISEWEVIRLSGQCAQAARNANRPDSALCIDVKDQELNSKLEKLSKLILNKQFRKDLDRNYEKTLAMLECYYR